MLKVGRHEGFKVCRSNVLLSVSSSNLVVACSTIWRHQLYCQRLLLPGCLGILLYPNITDITWMGFCPWAKECGRKTS
ncbi:hypothetical protein SLEP1_g21401 [Rubroshorea leprosula]|uniref:Uncharacterized protein n=1 Tax=Rubroshorea leprosula TaxID=152421 RepID=A0AAV5JBV9_9ROSI|nr:hypothetical protein SLEP1_g21401 [Rubroshorea leprosula]